MALIAPIAVSVATGLLVGGAVNMVIGQGAQTDFGVSIDKLISAGSAGVAITVMWLWMRRDEKQQIVHHETIKSLAKDFNETSTGIAKSFAETVKANDERATQREQRLHEAYTKLMENHRP
jgi:hypothetical protein